MSLPLCSHATGLNHHKYVFIQNLTVAWNGFCCHMWMLLTCNKYGLQCKVCFNENFIVHSQCNHVKQGSILQLVYCNVFGRLETRSLKFGLLIGFINHLQVVTTINYNTVPDSHNLQSQHAHLFTLSAVVFMYSVSLNHTLQIKPSVHTISLHMMNFPRLSLKIFSWSLKQSQIHCQILQSILVSNCCYIAFALTTWKTTNIAGMECLPWCCADWYLTTNYKHSSHCWAHLHDWRVYTDHCLETLWPSTSQYVL
jgi:hypothetical protein